MSAATPLEHAVALETFAEALFDSHASQSGLQPRWSTVREATRTHWRNSVAAAAAYAWRSQFSPLAGEPIPDAPEPYRVFAVELARTLGAARSRARTPTGLRQAMKLAGGKSFTLWYSAIRAGCMAVCRARGAAIGGERNMLLEALPDIRRAA